MKISSLKNSPLENSPLGLLAQKEFTKAQVLSIAASWSGAPITGEPRILGRFIIVKWKGEACLSDHTTLSAKIREKLKLNTEDYCILSEDTPKYQENASIFQNSAQTLSEFLKES